MNLTKAQSRAGSVRTPKQAAELYNEIEYELALGDPDPAQEQNGERALAKLRDRFPGVEDQAREVERPPSLSRTGKHNLDEPEGGEHRQPHRRARGGAHSRPSSSRGRRGGHPPRAPRSSTPAPRSSSSGGRSSSSGRTGSGPGISDLVPGFDATDSALFILRAILVLGVGYFLLTRRGSSALSTLLGGITTGVRLIVSPVDPLAGAAGLPGAAAGPRQATAAQVNAATNPNPPVSANTSTGNNPRGTAIPTTLTPVTARAVNIATGAVGSHVRQSTGPYGGGSTP